MMPLTLKWMKHYRLQIKMVPPPLSESFWNSKNVASMGVDAKCWMLNVDCSPHDEKSHFPGKEKWLRLERNNGGNHFFTKIQQTSSLKFISQINGMKRFSIHRNERIKASKMKTSEIGNDFCFPHIHKIRHHNYGFYNQKSKNHITSNTKINKQTNKKKTNQNYEISFVFHIS